MKDAPCISLLSPGATFCSLLQSSWCTNPTVQKNATVQKFHSTKYHSTKILLSWFCVVVGVSLAVKVLGLEGNLPPVINHINRRGWDLAQAKHCPKPWRKAKSEWPSSAGCFAKQCPERNKHPVLYMTNSSSVLRCGGVKTDGYLLVISKGRIERLNLSFIGR